jgi:hypothetical protein
VAQGLRLESWKVGLLLAVIALEQGFNRVQASHLRLTFVPNKNGSGSATLTALRVFA